MFSGEVMMAIHWSRPSSVLPMLTSFMRGLSAASFFQ